MGLHRYYRLFSCSLCIPLIFYATFIQHLLSFYNKFYSLFMLKITNNYSFYSHFITNFTQNHLFYNQFYTTNYQFYTTNYHFITNKLLILLSFYSLFTLKITNKLSFYTNKSSINYHFITNKLPILLSFVPNIKKF